MRPASGAEPHRARPFAAAVLKHATLRTRNADSPPRWRRAVNCQWLRGRATNENGGCLASEFGPRERQEPRLQLARIGCRLSGTAIIRLALMVAAPVVNLSDGGHRPVLSLSHQMDSTLVMTPANSSECPLADRGIAR